MADDEGSEMFQKLMKVARAAGSPGPKYRVDNPYQFSDALFMKYVEQGDPHMHECLDLIVSAIGDVRPHFKGKPYTKDEVWAGVHEALAQKGYSPFPSGFRIAFDAILDDVIGGDFYKNKD